jgi:DNA invertase Pin-like site-specific DNA recombinase
VFAALAEFERELVRERTTAACARVGRPSVMTTPHKLTVAREMYASGRYTVRRSPRSWA